MNIRDRNYHWGAICLNSSDDLDLWNWVMSVKDCNMHCCCNDFGVRQLHWIWLAWSKICLSLTWLVYVFTLLTCISGCYLSNDGCSTDIQYSAGKLLLSSVTRKSCIVNCLQILCRSVCWLIWRNWAIIEDVLTAVFFNHSLEALSWLLRKCQHSSSVMCACCLNIWV